MDVSNWTDEDAAKVINLLSMKGGTTPQEREQLLVAVETYNSTKRQNVFNSSVNASPKETPWGDTSPKPGPSGPPSHTTARADFLRHSRGTARFDPRSLHAHAAEEGVDIKTGAPAEWRTRSSLLEGNRGKEMYLQYEAKKALEEAGHKVPPGQSLIFQEPRTGKLGYYRAGPDGQIIPTLLDEWGFSGKDVTTAWPAAASIAVESAAEAAGAAYGAAKGGPKGAVVGGAVAAGFSNYAVNAAKRKAAIHLLKSRYPDDPDVERIINNIENDDQLDEALTAGLITGGMPVIESAIRSYRNLGRPIDFNDGMGEKDFYKHLDEHHREYVEAAAEGEAKVRKYNDLAESVGGKPISPNVAELTTDIALQIEAQTAKRRIFGKVARNEMKRDVRNHRSVADTIKRLAFREAPPQHELTDVLDRTAETTEQVKRVVQGETKMYEEAADFIADDLDSTIREAAEGYDEFVFRHTQASAFDNKEESYKVLKQHWSNVDKIGGYDPDKKAARIMLDNRDDNSRIKTYVKGLIQENEKRLTEEHRREGRRFIRNLFPDPEDEEGSGALYSIMDDFIDMKQLHYTLSHLKKDLRNANLAVANGNEPRWEPERLRGLITAIEDQVRIDRKFANEWKEDGTRIPDFRKGRLGEAKANAYADAWIAANNYTARHHEIWDNGVARNIIERDANGDFVMDPIKIRDTLFRPKDSSGLAAVLEGTGHTPTTKAKLAEQLLVKWQEMAMPNDKPSLSGLRRFNQEFSEHMNILFTPEQAAKVSTGRDLEAQVRRLTGEAKRYRAIMKENFGADLAGDKFHGDIVEMSMSPKTGLTPDQIRNLKEKLGQVDFSLVQDLRTQGMEKIKQTFLEAGGEEANLPQLEKMLSDGNFRGKIGAWFSEQYVKDLDKIRDVSVLINSGKGIPGIPDEHQPALLAITRSFIGPMDPLQRKLTAGNRYTRKRMRERTAAALANPEAVRSLIKLYNNPNQQQARMFFYNFLEQTGGALTQQEAEFAEQYENDRFNQYNLRVDGA